MTLACLKYGFVFLWPTMKIYSWHEANVIESLTVLVWNLQGTKIDDLSNSCRWDSLTVKLTKVKESTATSKKNKNHQITYRGQRTDNSIILIWNNFTKHIKRTAVKLTAHILTCIIKKLYLQYSIIQLINYWILLIKTITDNCNAT